MTSRESVVLSAKFALHDLPLYSNMGVLVGHRILAIK